MSEHEQQQEEQKGVRVLELFAGIGGMRLALSYAGVVIEEAIAVEVSEQALEVYAHNFGTAGLVKRDLLGLNTAWFEKQRCKVWTMSPPCQPYTRQGKVRDTEDPRAKPLLHIISVLKEVPTPPDVLVLENVQNFERSDSCALLLEALASRGYSWRGFLLSPRQFGFPNARQRFYLVAKRNDHPFRHVPVPSTDSAAEQPSCTPWSYLPCPASSSSGSRAADAAWAKAEEDAAAGLTGQLEQPLGFCSSCGRAAPATPAAVDGENLPLNGAEEVSACTWTVAPISTFLDSVTGLSTLAEVNARSTWEVQEEILSKEAARCFDVIHSDCRHSLCFTKAYSRYIDGTGSVFVMPATQPREPSNGSGFTMQEFLGVLRYFTPSEVAKLMGFKMRIHSGKEACCDGGMCLPACSRHEGVAYGGSSVSCECPAFSLPDPTAGGTEPEPTKAARKLWGLLGNSLNPQVVGLVCSACEVPQALGFLAGRTTTEGSQ